MCLLELNEINPTLNGNKIHKLVVQGVSTLPTAAAGLPAVSRVSHGFWRTLVSGVPAVGEATTNLLGNSTCYLF